jgi:predicted HTH transcriptional regulator
MTTRLRVFVSSVQKELEDERLIVQNLLNTDAFLAAHCAPVLYEFEPASPDKALAGCLKALDACQVYLLIVAAQYGTLVGDISITQAEYRRARSAGLPVLAFIKGERAAKREAGTDALLQELDADGPKYKRFGNVIELQREVRAALVRLLEDRFGIAPSTDENEIAQQTIEATSAFESQPLTELFQEARNTNTHLIVERIVNDIDEIVKKVRFPDWQHTSQGERLVQRELRKALLKYQLHRDQELFDRAYEYIREYY